MTTFNEALATMIANYQSPAPRTVVPMPDFETVVTEKRQKLVNYAFKLTRNLDDAEDLVQTTFLKAFRIWDTIQNTNLDGYLYRAIHNSWVSQVRKDSRKQSLDEFLETHNGSHAKYITETVRDTEEEALTKMELDRTIKFLSHVDENRRQSLVICLFYRGKATQADRSRTHNLRVMLRTYREFTDNG